MKEAARQKLVYIIAGVGILLAAYVQFGIKVKKATPVASADPALIAASPIAAQTIPTVGSPAPGVSPSVAGTKNTKSLPTGWGRDPFLSGQSSANEVAESADPAKDTEQEARHGWVLGGIFYVAEKPVAYVNDQPVHIGQVVNGAMVTEITKSSVILNVRGERVTLTLGKG